MVGLVTMVDTASATGLQCNCMGCPMVAGVALAAAVVGTAAKAAVAGVATEGMGLRTWVQLDLVVLLAPWPRLRCPVSSPVHHGRRPSLKAGPAQQRLVAHTELLFVVSVAAGVAV